MGLCGRAKSSLRRGEDYSALPESPGALPVPARQRCRVIGRPGPGPAMTNSPKSCVENGTDRSEAGHKSVFLQDGKKGSSRHDLGSLVLEHLIVIFLHFPAMTEKEDGSRAPSDVERGVEEETSVGVPYTIYSKKQKIAIILAASVASFFSPMSANIYIPALNSVAADLHVSNTLINLTLTTYLVRPWSYFGSPYQPC
jgi:hypothetical protein